MLHSVCRWWDYILYISVSDYDLLDSLNGLTNHFVITQLLERALEACGNDLDSAIKSLNELRLGSTDNKPDSMGTNDQLPSQGTFAGMYKLFQVWCQNIFWLQIFPECFQALYFQNVVTLNLQIFPPSSER